MIDYRIVQAEIAVKNNYPDAQQFEDWGDTWDMSCVYRFEGETPIELIGWDGGEPEDQVLYRDWAWVPKALKKAYDLGREHGQ